MGFTKGFWSLIALVLLLMPIAVFAQATEGVILGTVRDPTGAVVPGVAVTVTNVGTNISRQVTTGASGDYAVPELPVGEYNVKAKREGFNTKEVTHVRLAISEAVRVDINLELGATSQQVSVSGDVESIRTDSAELAYHVQKTELLDLPLNGRDYLNLAQLVPGANAGLNDNRRQTYGNTIVVAGSRAEANNYMVDGISNNEWKSGGFVVVPSVDAIQEFKVQTSQFSAEYGNAGGAVVNISIKSGTNAFHGTLYEFLRNDKLDARSFFDATRLPFKRNQFGGTIGGPIQKDRTFFFFNYEGRRIRQSPTQFGNVPESGWVNGDFSKAPFTIYDPATAHPDPNNLTRIIRDPFPGNNIRQDRIDLIGKKIAAAYAAPNFFQPGNPFNFVSTRGNPNNQKQINARIDRQIGQADQLFGRFTYQNTKEFDAGLGAFPRVDGTDFDNKGIQATVSETHIFSPTFLNELRLGYGYLQSSLFSADRETSNGRDLGIPGLNPPPFQSGFIDLTVQNLASPDHPAGFGKGAPALERDEIFQFNETMSLLTSNHRLKFGADIARAHFASAFGTPGGASLTFSGRYTSAVGGTFAPVGFADLLLGLPDFEDLNRTLDLGYYRWWNNAFFIQDDWHLSPNLTVNVGLRYELTTPAKEVSGKESIMDVDAGQALIQKRVAPYLQSVLGLTIDQLPFPVHVVDSDHFYDAPKTNFAPRFGLAYRPFGSNRTTIRTGAGIFYVSALGNVLANSNFNPPFTFDLQTNGDPIAPNLKLSNGFPTSVIDALRFPSYTADYTFKDWKTGYYAKWSFGIQHQITSRITFDTSYLGSQGENLPALIRKNVPPPGPGPIQPRRQFPLLGTAELVVPAMPSSYHGWLNQLHVRGWRGLTLEANYTFSKAMDDQSALAGAGEGKAGDTARAAFPGFSLDADHARASFDARHRFTVDFIYAVPKFENLNPGLRYVLGDWQISTILTLQSGFPLPVLLRTDVANVGATGGFFPNRLCDGNLPPSQRTPQRWFDTSCFAVPDQFTLGNSGRNILEQDGIRNVDFALLKNIPLRAIGESHYLQFRGEFFNLFNNVNFDRPGLIIARSAFGRVTSTTIPGRQIQFGLKYIF